MPLARMATATEYFADRLSGTRMRKARPIHTLVHEDYMELAADYADYVCSHEKWIDYTGLKGIERIENLSPIEKEAEQRVLYPKSKWPKPSPPVVSALEKLKKTRWYKRWSAAQVEVAP